MTVVGCVQRSNGYGVLINEPAPGSSGLVVERCDFDLQNADLGDGVEVNAPTNGFSDILIANRVVQNAYGLPAGGIGYGFANCQNIQIVGCLAENCANDGFHIEDRSSNVLISACSAIDCTKGSGASGAIAILTGSKAVTVTGCTIRGTGATPGITVFTLPETGVARANENIIITGNELTNTASACVLISGVLGCTSSGNVLLNPAANTSAISVNYGYLPSNRITIIGNRCGGAASTASVTFEGAAGPGSLVIGNDFSECGTKLPNYGDNIV